MADFVPPQFQYPDFLRSAAMGQQVGQQQAMAPLQLQSAQQGVESGQLNLDMLRQVMGMKQQALKTYQDTMAGIGGPGDPGASGGPSGGVQNGPQGQPQSNDPLAPFLDPRRIAANTAYGQFNAMTSGKDPNEATANGLKLEQAARTDQLERQKIQDQPQLNMLDGVINSDSPARTVMANPAMIAHWPEVARQMGLDPVKDFNDANVRKSLAMSANQIRARSGQPAKDYPVGVQNVPLGQGETAQIDPVTGKKVGDLTDRQPPTFDLKPVWDPTTNSTVQRPVQTGGYGMAGVGPTGNTVSVGKPPAGSSGAAVASKFPLTAASLGYNTGMKPPTDPETKAAMFGSEMRSGLQTLRTMEDKGFSLNPTARAAFIHAATSEDSGAISQFLGQEGLAHGMSKESQTYLAAVMPVLQAVGHDQSGARLPTAAIRQILESSIPIDAKNKEALEQVNKNREGFYTGVLTQAGSAVQLPQYKNTLGADLKQTQSSAKYQEGQTASGPGGAKMIFKGGKWQPHG